MTDIKDGGPAFPVEVDSAQPYGRQTGNTVWQAYGLSMRDYFAAKAMQATLSDNKNVVVLQHTSEKFGEEITSCLAKMSYAYADAMLRAREVNHG